MVGRDVTVGVESGEEVAGLEGLEDGLTPVVRVGEGEGVVEGVTAGVRVDARDEVVEAVLAGVRERDTDEEVEREDTGVRVNDGEEEEVRVPSTEMLDPTEALTPALKEGETFEVEEVV